MRITLFLTILMALAQPAAAELTVGGLFGDGMVLQRNTTVSVWGTAEPGTEITVAIADRTATARADAKGNWRAVLQPMAAGGPHELIVEANEQRLSFANVLVGDVWICSGQSNMEWTVADSMNAAQEIGSARDFEIRQFKVPRSWAEKPETSLAGGSWEPADPEHVGAFTAVGYFFARELRRHHDVPIGLINTSWGGSRIEPWMSAESLGIDDARLRAILESEEAFAREVLDRISKQTGGLPASDPGLVDGCAVWAEPDFDDTGWPTLEVPSRWEEHGYEGMDGIVWYRTAFELSAAEARAGVRLGLGPIDDSDISWVNGHEVGRTVLAWNSPRVYDVPPAFLHEGRNVAAVRVEDTGGGGGIWGDPELLFVEVAGARRSLAGPWKIGLGLVTVNADARKNQVPTMLYNKMVHPLLPYPVAGFLWYQGESNADADGAFVYRDLFAAMIKDWRLRWGSGNLPFLWVQLANYMAAADRPGDSDWAMLRESQSAVLALPKTAQAVIIDIGEADDIHPRNKQEVGRRLALAAREVAFGEKIVFSGPVYRSHEVRDGRVIIDFDHIGGGLVAQGNANRKLAEFAIAGADRRFVWAEAIIEGNQLVVWSDEVQDPVAVRYAWADNPDGANLYNAEGLPASPFRTDSW
jgi:sialate O-acetylesterase